VDLGVRGRDCTVRVFAHGQPKWIEATMTRNTVKRSAVTSRLGTKSAPKMPDLTRSPVSDSQSGQAQDIAPATRRGPAP